MWYFLGGIVFSYCSYKFYKGFTERWKQLDREAAVKRNQRKPPNTDDVGSVSLRGE